jgi:HEAT repeat protein
MKNKSKVYFIHLLKQILSRIGVYYMQSTVANTIKLIKNHTDLGKRFPKEVIPYLLKAAENSNAQIRNDIENQIIKIGDSAIETLINSLETSSGYTRALIAMCLIRIGNPSINSLKSACKNNSDLNWIADYIINEIEGTKRSLGQNIKFAQYQEILVG